jgi:hypothetical protein
MTLAVRSPKQADCSGIVAAIRKLLDGEAHISIFLIVIRPTRFECGLSYTRFACKKGV